MQNTAQRLLALILTSAILLTMVLLPGCAQSKSQHNASASTNASDISSSSSQNSTKPKNVNTSRIIEETPSYKDSRWPTNNKELLAIPKAKRWYNASKHIGERCTIAGPIANTYQATSSNGSPIFLDIGAAYPNKKRVSILIWDEDIEANSQLLDSVYGKSGCWISVTGCLTKYNGNMQMKSSDGLSYTWWTGINNATNRKANSIKGEVQ